VLNSLFLIGEKLLSLPILYLSRYIICNKDDYYGLLTNVTRHNAWEPWLLYMIEAVRNTAGWTTAKIGAIRALSEATIAYTQQQLPKIYTRELVDLLFEQPYCRIANLVDAGVAKRQTASQYLSLLVKYGILEERKMGREKLFVNTKLMRLLTSDNNDFIPYCK